MKFIYTFKKVNYKMTCIWRSLPFLLSWIKTLRESTDTAFSHAQNIQIISAVPIRIFKTPHFVSFVNFELSLIVCCVKVGNKCKYTFRQKFSIIIFVKGGKNILLELIPVNTYFDTIVPVRCHGYGENNQDFYGFKIGSYLDLSTCILNTKISH